MSGEYKRAAELLRTMANVARSRGDEPSAQAHEAAADEMTRLDGEETTARTRVVVCKKCGSVVSGEMIAK